MKSFGRWLAAHLALCHVHKINFWSSIALTGWAGILICNSAPITPNFTVALMIFNEERLELLALAIGLLQFSGVISGNKWFRVIASGLAAWLLLTLGYSLGAAGDVTPGVSIYICWGCINLHSMIAVINRRKREQR